MVRRGLRPNTIGLRRAVLRRLELHAGKALTEITIEDLRTYIDRLEDAGSRAAESTQLRSFFQWATLEGHLDVDPSYRLESIRRRKYLPRPIPDDLLGKALAAPPERLATMLWLAAYAGLRACDISQLRGEHLMFDRTPPMIYIAESKGGKPRSIPMAPQLSEKLQSLPRQGWCYPYVMGNRPGHITPHYVSKLCNDYLHSLGMTETLHQLRHWFVTKVYAVDKDLVVAQELAGHESISTTRLYTWVDPGAAAATVQLLPAV